MTNNLLNDRFLPLEGGFNFRDLGEIALRGGAEVKRGLVFRGDELNKLTRKDLDYFSAIELISIVDFRSAQEIAAAPDRRPESLKHHYALSIDPGSITGKDANSFGDVTAEEVEDFMSAVYGFFVSDADAVNMYREFFKLLQNPAETPLLFHCTAGKDRTGVAAALFLYSLGADDDTVMEEYLLTNVGLEKKYGVLKKDYPELKPMFEAEGKYLETFINAVRDKHGSMEKYLTAVLNVDLAKMRGLYITQNEK
ncbi:protein-tyrosine phosphatase [Parelusimicrobium proximum]|uniref:tyrosine-protein phosphatase n=1 Tax=Parelusimicrobium proximum TaxID=3228953 RepID=UPI003D16ECE7